MLNKIFLLLIALGLCVSCKKSTSTSVSSSPDVKMLQFEHIIISDTPIVDERFSGYFRIPYTNGNGVAFGSGKAIISEGVKGLNATLKKGTLKIGKGWLTFSLSGIPKDTGKAEFYISFAGKSGMVEISVKGKESDKPLASPKVSSLEFKNVNISTEITTKSKDIGGVFLTLPYVGGNGENYEQGDTIDSRGVKGLSVVLKKGKLKHGNGFVIYLLSGTPKDSGIAKFPVSFGGETGMLSIHVKPVYHLVFEDNFNGRKGSEMNLDKWEYRQLGPRNDAINVEDAVLLDGEGHLIIRTYTENGTNKTGMIKTKKMWTYGKFEARIKFQGTPGMWSAFWVQSPTMGRYIGNPEKSGVELDIIEHRVHDGGDNDIAAKGESNIHWDGYGADHKSKGSGLIDNMYLDQGFHTYTLEWTAFSYAFYYDDKLIWSVNQPISNAPEYIILSSEVSNHTWAGTVPSNKYGSFENSNHQMIVDYVKVYKKK